MKWIPASEVKDRQHYVKVCGRIVQGPGLYVWGSFHWDGSRKMWHDWIQRPVDESILEILTDESAPTSADTGLREAVVKLCDRVELYFSECRLNPKDKGGNKSKAKNAMAIRLRIAKEALSTPPGGERREDIENACIDSLLKEFNRQGFDTSNWDGDEGWEKAIVDGVSSLTGQGESTELKEVLSLGISLVERAYKHNEDEETQWLGKAESFVGRATVLIPIK